MMTQENIFSNILTVSFIKRNSGVKNHCEWKIKVVIPKNIKPILSLTIVTSYIFKSH